MPFQGELHRDEKCILEALYLRACCFSALRIAGQSFNTQPVCILDNENDFFSVLCDPAYESLSEKSIIVDDNSGLSRYVFRILRCNNVKIMEYDVAEPSLA